MLSSLIRRRRETFSAEDFDPALFWNSSHLRRKLAAFQGYYNLHRVHRSLAGVTPAERGGGAGPVLAKLEWYGWQVHCRGLFQTMVAA